MAVEDTRLYWVAQREAQISNALLKVAEATQDYDDLGQALGSITQIASLLSGVDRCAIWLRTQALDIFEPAVASGFGPDALAFFQRYPIKINKVAAVKLLSQTGNPLVITQAGRHKRLPPELVAGLNLDCLVLLPILAHGDMLGLMLVTLFQII